MGAASLTLDIVIEDADQPLWQAFGNVEALVGRAAEAVAAHPRLKLDNAEAALALSSDAAVKELNTTYRQQPKATNVLSFPAPRMPTPRGAPRFLGDIVLAAETIEREAKDLGIPLANHFQHLVVHGTLHLLGFDHETEAEAQVMEGLEIEILRTLDIENPYRDHS
jgi:probable rRNA maturation factor